MPPRDALREALAQVVADQRKDWRRERELIAAQAGQQVAEARAGFEALKTQHAAEHAARMAELERAIAAVPTEAEIERRIADGVAAAIAEMPTPAPGKDGASVTADDVAPLIDEAVARAVDALPKAKDGEPGRDGAPGKLPAVEIWEDRVYGEADVVTHAGAMWQATRATGKEPPHADWRCLARAGRDGVDARTPIVRGTFSETETYQALDVVALNGASFIARTDNPGPCPGEGWQLMSAQGKRGKPGEPGPAGQRGKEGPPGPSIIAAALDATGLQTITLEDGSTVKCDLSALAAASRT